MASCTKCKKEVPQGMKYCPNCGAKAPAPDLAEVAAEVAEDRHEMVAAFARVVELAERVEVLEMTSGRQAQAIVELAKVVEALEGVLVGDEGLQRRFRDLSESVAKVEAFEAEIVAFEEAVAEAKAEEAVEVEPKAGGIWAWLNGSVGGVR